MSKAHQLPPGLGGALQWPLRGPGHPLPQDRQDERRFAKIEATMAQQGSDLKLLGQKLVYISTAGGVLASVAFQIALKIPEWLSAAPP